MADRHLTEVYSLFADWAAATGLENARDLPGLWHGKIGRFNIALNGKHYEVEGVPPYCLSITSEGDMLLGIISPFEGALLVGVEVDLIADLKAAIAEATA